MDTPIQVDLGSLDGEKGADHQHGKNGEVNFGRNNVMFRQILLPATVSLVPINKIEQRKQKDPDNVNEVPI